jgi:hypothetical protein
MAVFMVEKTRELPQGREGEVVAPKQEGYLLHVQLFWSTAEHGKGKERDMHTQRTCRPFVGVLVRLIGGDE